MSLHWGDRVVADWRPGALGERRGACRFVVGHGANVVTEMRALRMAADQGPSVLFYM
jgi:hypothetical protein